MHLLINVNAFTYINKCKRIFSINNNIKEIKYRIK